MCQGDGSDAGSGMLASAYPALFAVLNPVVGTVTITLGSPGVVTRTAHGLQTGQRVYLTTTGALPTGLTTYKSYYVVYVTANTFELATTLANARSGATINMTVSQSGTHTLSTTFGIQLDSGNVRFSTPAPSGRAIIGAGVDVDSIENRLPGMIGGTRTHTLTTTEMPAHAHSGATSTDGEHGHGGVTGAEGGHDHGGDTGDEPIVGAQGGTTVSNSTTRWAQGGGGTNTMGTIGGSEHSHTIAAEPNHIHGIANDGDHSHTIASEGGGQAHNNESPYLALNYIIKT